MVIKIKIQITFLIKFCVTDLAVSTSVIVNMSRFIPPKRPWPQRSSLQVYGSSKGIPPCDVVELSTFLLGFWQFFCIKKNKTIPWWLILWFQFDTFHSKPETKMTKMNVDEICFVSAKKYQKEKQFSHKFI